MVPIHFIRYFTAVQAFCIYCITIYKMVLFGTRIIQSAWIQSVLDVFIIHYIETIFPCVIIYSYKKEAVLIPVEQTIIKEDKALPQKTDFYK